MIELRLRLTSSERTYYGANCLLFRGGAGKRFWGPKAVSPQFLEPSKNFLRGRILKKKRLRGSEFC